jgi:hypothetical protein
MWLYSTTEGFVERVERFLDKHILKKMTEADNPDEIVVVAKRPTLNPRTHRNSLIHTPLNSKDLEKRIHEFTHGERVCV